MSIKLLLACSLSTSIVGSRITPVWELVEPGVQPYQPGPQGFVLLSQSFSEDIPPLNVPAYQPGPQGFVLTSDDEEDSDLEGGRDYISLPRTPGLMQSREARGTVLPIRDCCCGCFIIGTVGAAIWWIWHKNS